MLVKRLSMNTIGKDYIVGDIHGCFDLVIEAMRRVGFNQKTDRLISLGDTIDRGPGSPRALQFLRKPWTHSLRGNHEAMLMDLYSGAEPSEAVIQFATRSNGMGWWVDYPKPSRKDLIACFKKLPVAIELETMNGTIGLVHAEVPQGLIWSEFTWLLEQRNDDVIEQAVWSRTKIETNDHSVVSGIKHVFVGHTIVKTPKQLGNVFYVDTGAVVGLLTSDHTRGKLTFFDANIDPECLCQTEDNFDFLNVKTNNKIIIEDKITA